MPVEDFKKEVIQTLKILFPLENTLYRLRIKAMRPAWGWFSIQVKIMIGSKWWGQNSQIQDVFQQQHQFNVPVKRMDAKRAISTQSKPETQSKISLNKVKAHFLGLFHIKSQLALLLCEMIRNAGSFFPIPPSPRFTNRPSVIHNGCPFRPVDGCPPHAHSSQQEVPHRKERAWPRRSTPHSAYIP